MRKVRPQIVFYLYGLLSVCYVVLSLIIPIDSRAYSTRYHLSSTAVRTLSLSIILPYVIIWFVSFYGYVRTHSYALLIKDNPDGKSMATIAQGLLYLALFLPVSSLLSLLVTYIGQTDPSMRGFVTIVNNYIILLITLAGFYTLMKGSTSLVSIIKPKTYARKEQAMILLFIITSATYAYFILTNPSRHHPLPGNNQAAYYLPDLLLLTTIVIPYMYALYCGIRAAFNIQIYLANVHGSLYKRALNALAYGIALTTLGTIALRVLSSIASWVNSISKLRIILLVVYVLLIIIGVGFSLIATSARRLQKIEEA